MRWFLALSVLSVLSVAHAQPKASITDPNGNPAPESVPIGEAVYLSARQAVHAGTPGSVRWIVRPRAREVRSRQFDGGLELCIPTGQEAITLSVVQIVVKDDQIDVAELEIRIGGGAVVPPPVPGPTPPTPPKPEVVPPEPGELGLVRASWDGRRAVQRTEAEAVVLAKAHRDEAEAARKTPFALPAEMQQGVATRIKAGLSQDARLGWSGWQAAVAARVSALEREGRLTNRQQWIQAFEEIAAGLEARN